MDIGQGMLGFSHIATNIGSLRDPLDSPLRGEMFVALCIYLSPRHRRCRMFQAAKYSVDWAAPS